MYASSAELEKINKDIKANVVYKEIRKEEEKSMQQKYQVGTTAGAQQATHQGPEFNKVYSYSFN